MNEVQEKKKKKQHDDDDEIAGRGHFQCRPALHTTYTYTLRSCAAALIALSTDADFLNGSGGTRRAAAGR